MFLTDGRVKMYDNVVENAIRPLALNRKNALFAGHDEGAAAWARIATLTETAKMNGVNPHALPQGHARSHRQRPSGLGNRSAAKQRERDYWTLLDIRSMFWLARHTVGCPSVDDSGTPLRGS